MSLVRRLWIVIGLITLAAMLTAAGINMLSAKRYLENELKVKNLDTATALAISISQTAADATTVELLVSSQFDLGHYQSIDYMGPDGRLRLHRELESRHPSAPTWFMRLVRIEPEPGFAEIQSGWQQLGSIKLRSDTSFAYDSMWKSALTLVESFVVGGVLVGVLGTLFIRSIIRPLKRVVEQAEGLAQRRLIQIKPPGTLEFKLIVEAMNRFAIRMKSILDDESSRLEKLKTDFETDSLTGYMTRSIFLRNVASEIEREDTEEEGTLLLVHIENLERLNQEIGRVKMDQLIQGLADRIKRVLQERFRVRYGRLNAADLAMLFPGHIDRLALLQLLRAQILSDEGNHLLRIRVGAAGYGPKSNIADLLAECDHNLTPIAGEGRLAYSSGVAVAGRGEQAWAQIFDVALRSHEFRLATFPVRGRDNAYICAAALARLHSSVAAEILVAGAFLPWARKQGLGGQLDLEILSIALAELKELDHDVCITLGFQSVCDERQSRLISEHLSRNMVQARRLHLNIPEEVAFEYPAEFRRFCELVTPSGCKIGVQHLDRYVGHLGQLHDLGLHSIKVDRSLIKEVANDATSSIMLRGLCTIAHTMGLQVIAEGVTHSTDANLLFELGFDAVAGPGIV